MQPFWKLYCRIVLGFIVMALLDGFFCSVLYVTEYSLPFGLVVLFLVVVPHFKRAIKLIDDMLEKQKGVVC